MRDPSPIRSQIPGSSARYFVSSRTCGTRASADGVKTRTAPDFKIRSMGTPTTDLHADIKDPILETVGETPLVRLSRIGAGLAPAIVAKLELLNPGGSIKDRVALRLVQAAERDGRPRPG